jgi:hypothetical protein
MNDNYYSLNEDTYADLVCLDSEETKAIFKWLRKKGLDSQEIVTNAIGCFAMMTLLTDEEKTQISDVMGKLGNRLIKTMAEGEND